jgi:hypothetical protein
MLDCFTPDVQANLQALFTRMSRDELRAMAESFIGFSMQGGGELREAAIVRQQKDRRMAGFVTFVNDGGAWKISAM